MKISKQWSYHYHFLKQFDWLYPLVTVMVISELIMVFAIFIASPANILYTLKELRFIFYIITGIFIFSGLLTILIYKGGYTYHYFLENNELISVNKPLAIDHQTQVNIRIGHHVDLIRVKKLILDTRNNRIKIRGFLTITGVYASNADLEEVWQALIESCPQAQKIR